MTAIPPDGESSRLLPQDGEASGTMSDMSPTQLPRHARRTDWRMILVGGFAVLAAGGLAVYSAAASYETVAHLAAAHRLALSQFYPASTDGGLIVVIGLDVGLTWAGRPLGSLRLMARLFALATVAANFAAGWPDVTGALLRVAPPVLFVILAEAARAVLLRRHRELSGAEGIPFSRWVLAFRPTFRLWRRMRLWRVTDYGTAVDLELSRLRAIEQLRHKFGETWEKKVPGDLAWMLSEGVRMGEALPMVGELCAPSPALTPVIASVSRKRQSPPRGKRKAGASAETIDSQAQALAEYMINPSINGRQMGDALGLSPSRGRALLAMARQEAPDTGPIPRITEAR